MYSDHGRSESGMSASGQPALGGQTLAEFALLVPLLMLIIFLAITFAVIGEDALAVSQLASAGARYASVNPTMSASDIASYIKSGSLGAPTITGNGARNLTVTVTQAASFGQPVTVTISNSLGNDPLVSSMSSLFSALGLAQSLPTNLSATESVMTE